MGEEIPDELHRTNISTEVPGDDVAAPGIVDAALADGGITAGRYFSRLGAVPLERPAGSMHRASAAVVGACDVGVAAAGLSVWIDVRSSAHRFELEVTGGDELQGMRTVELEAGGHVVPWSAIGAGPGARIGVRVVVRDQAGRIVETVPSDGVERRLALPDGLGAAAWTA